MDVWHVRRLLWLQRRYQQESATCESRHDRPRRRQPEQQCKDASHLRTEDIRRYQNESRRPINLAEAATIGLSWRGPSAEPWRDTKYSLVLRHRRVKVSFLLQSQPRPAVKGALWDPERALPKLHLPAASFPAACIQPTADMLYVRVRTLGKHLCNRTNIVPVYSPPRCPFRLPICNLG